MPPFSQFLLMKLNLASTNDEDETGSLHYEYSFEMSRQEELMKNPSLEAEVMSEFLNHPFTSEDDMLKRVQRSNLGAFFF